MKKPVVLLDSDGVLSNFVGGYLELVYRYTRVRLSEESVDTYAIEDSTAFKALTENFSSLQSWVEQEISTSNFCFTLEPYPGAREGVDALRQVAEVLVVTSPWHSSSRWMHERAHWLEAHFGFSHQDVIHASRKEFVHGDVLVDDKPANLEYWPHGRGILWDRPYNRTSALRRMKDWRELLDLVSSQ